MANTKISNMTAIAAFLDAMEVPIYDGSVAVALQNKKFTITQLKSLIWTSGLFFSSSIQYGIYINQGALGSGAGQVVDLGVQAGGLYECICAQVADGNQRAVYHFGWNGVDTYGTPDLVSNDQITMQVPSASVSGEFSFEITTASASTHNVLVNKLA